MCIISQNPAVTLAGRHYCYLQLTAEENEVLGNEKIQLTYKELGVVYPTAFFHLSLSPSHIYIGIRMANYGLSHKRVHGCK